jgi:ABC-2 type transport system ATP-binding protein
METIIHAERLTKTFRVASRRPGLAGSLRSIVDPDMRIVHAVQAIDLDVERGEMIGLVGPNGAGKSTTIKMLTGILVPSSGLVRVTGLEPVRQRRYLAAQIGAVFGQRTQLWWDLPLIDSLRLLQHLYRMPDARFIANLIRLREMLALDEFLNTPVRQLSLGQRMRGDLAAALVHDPVILFLDEPTIGLDVVAKASIRAFLRELNAERATTVLLTTHDMDDIEALCPRMVIIDHGRKLYDGTITAIRERYGSDRLLIAQIAADEIAALPCDGAGMPIIADLPAGVRLERAGESHLWLRFGREAAPAHELIGWLTAHFHLRDITSREPEIEDTIHRIYTEGLLLDDEATAR